MIKVFLKKKISTRIAEGHLWVYQNEIGDVVGTDIYGGVIVDVFSSNGSFVARGYYNPVSQIAIRLLSTRQEPIDEAFFLKKIKAALAYRQQLGFTENYRLVNSEADNLPGLVIDRFNDYFVVQCQTLGIDLQKQAIVTALNSLFQPKGIFERSDIPQRSLEGLPMVKGFLSTAFETRITLTEEGLKFYVDLENGLKTGYFLDNQLNRMLIRDIVKNADVLDMFCYTGSFSLFAAAYGAKSVLGIDYAEAAISLAKANAAQNGYAEICNFEVKNAFDFLKVRAKEKKQFGVVILDPPVLLHAKTNVEKALGAYKEINLRAMQLLKPGGFLVTTCATHLVTEEAFRAVLQDAAADVKRNLKPVSLQTQSADHAITWNMPNTQYLKFWIIQVN
ncbi:MAG: class I SAM-dependent rRNA methyltransferase [Sphingobacteriales bacterium]|nr:MAG: class I SAM-dependent rRNA methyltransferase [Sphingobacteriales bacterium]